MHDRSFHVVMQILYRVLFNVIFAIGVWHPLLLAMTATLTDSTLASFSTLTSVQWDASYGNNSWDSKRHFLWSDTTTFRQHYIYIGLNIGTSMLKTLLDSMIDLLLSSPTVCVCTFVNFASERSK